MKKICFSVFCLSSLVFLLNSCEKIDSSEYLSTLDNDAGYYEKEAFENFTMDLYKDLDSFKYFAENSEEILA